MRVLRNQSVRITTGEGVLELAGVDDHRGGYRGSSEDLPAALAVAREATWAQAHTRYAAEPTPERPDGAFIATAAPDRWAGHPVR